MGGGEAGKGEAGEAGEQEGRKLHSLAGHPVGQW